MKASQILVVTPIRTSQPSRLKTQLKNVSFEYSNISRARFGDAILNGVDFWRAYTYRTHFEDVDLRLVQRLSQLQLEIACGNANTRLPEDRLMPDSWPCEE